MSSFHRLRAHQLLNHLNMMTRSDGPKIRLTTMSPMYPFGKPCSRGTHNETVKNPALSPAFDHDSINRIGIERLP